MLPIIGAKIEDFVRAISTHVRSEYVGERGRAIYTSGYCQRATEEKNPALRKEDDRICLPLDVIFEILRRLPSKDILKFRVVSKLWRSLTQEHRFINQHLLNDPNPEDLGIIALYHHPLECELSLHYFFNGFHKVELTDLYEFEERDYHMSNSCNGLVCIYGRYTSYVVNPSIMKVLALPKTEARGQVSVALVQDISTGEYKVVRLFQGKSNRTGCEIFNLGSHSWRTAQDAPCSIGYNPLPIVINEAVHWLTKPGVEQENIVISFNIKKENFDVIVRPVGYKYGQDTCLAELDGSLCLSTAPDLLTHRTIWSLEDYNKRIWKKHCISFHGLRNSKPCHSVPLSYRDGKILWKNYSRFEYYDVKKERFLEQQNVNFAFHFKQVCAYRESLISPTTIQKDTWV